MSQFSLALSVYLVIGVTLALAAFRAVRRMREYGRPNQRAEENIRTYGPLFILAAITIYWPAAVAYVISHREKR